ncbi:MAG: XdhC family protein [Bordetella sp.]|nr:XdhC family protein [Bordetella sp.]
MDSLDVQVLQTARDWAARGDAVALVTVVRTWGSSPRPVGAMMALNRDGRTVGSVSGGCIEDDLIDRHAGPEAQGWDGAPVATLRYGVSADEAHRFGLPCGGTIELVVEFAPDPDTTAALLAQLRAGQLVRRTVCLETGRVTLSASDRPAPLQCDARTLAVTLGPAYRMLLIGAGNLAAYVATIAGFNGFEVTVCDPRREQLHTLSDLNLRITTEMPDDAVLAFRPDARSCIVALSHDPKLDDMALLEAIHSEAFYVGAIGSRRNNRARRERFITHFGESPASLARLRGPIGLYIGSKTPAEIAVSLMAEVIAVKNGVAVPPGLGVEAAKNHAERAALAASIDP